MPGYRGTMVCRNTRVCIAKVGNGVYPRHAKMSLPAPVVLRRFGQVIDTEVPLKTPTVGADMGKGAETAVVMFMAGVGGPNSADALVRVATVMA